MALITGTPWWASEWATRSTRPDAQILVPILGAVVVAWVAGRLLARAAARRPASARSNDAGTDER